MDNNNSFSDSSFSKHMSFSDSSSESNSSSAFKRTAYPQKSATFNDKPDIKGLEKVLLNQTLKAVDKHRKDSDDKVSKMLAYQALHTLLIIDNHLDSTERDITNGYLDKDLIKHANDQFGDSHFSDAMLSLMELRDRMYGLPKIN